MVELAGWGAVPENCTHVCSDNERTHADPKIVYDDTKIQLHNKGNSNHPPIHPSSTASRLSYHTRSVAQQSNFSSL